MEPPGSSQPRASPPAVPITPTVSATAGGSTARLGAMRRMTHMYVRITPLVTTGRSSGVNASSVPAASAAAVDGPTTSTITMDPARPISRWTAVR